MLKQQCDKPLAPSEFLLRTMQLIWLVIDFNPVQSKGYALIVTI